MDLKYPLSAKCISNIKVTYDTQAVPGYKYLGKTGQCQLWYCSSPVSSGECITCIDIFYNNEFQLESEKYPYIKVDNDLNNNKNNTKIFIAFLRDSFITNSANYITDIKVIPKSSASGEGYLRIEKDINKKNKGGELIFCYKPLNYIKSFRIHERVDVLDNVNKWCPATVSDVNTAANTVRVHYDGWGDKWDETISIDSSRVQKFRTYTTTLTDNQFLYYYGKSTKNSNINDYVLYKS